MDARRAEAMHGYYVACSAFLRAVAEWDRHYGGRGRLDRVRARRLRAEDEERAATVECLAGGVTLDELDALAALAGSRFAPRWARERYEVIG